MSFNTVGNIDVTVTDAYIAEPHREAKPGELNNKGIPVTVWADICVVVADRDGNNDIWKGELSNRTGNGTRAHQEQTEITLEKLVSIGFNVPTFNDLMEQCDDNNCLPNMIGLECTVTTEEREFEGKDGRPRKGIFVKYLNARGFGGPRRISKADFIARINGTQSASGVPPAGTYPTQTQMPNRSYWQTSPTQTCGQASEQPAPSSVQQSYPSQNYTQQVKYSSPYQGGSSTPPCPYN